MSKLHAGLRWAAAAATVIVALLLCWQCANIYLEGNSPANLDAAGVHLTPVFTVDKVAGKLAPLTPLFILYTLLVLAAIVLETFLPRAGSRTALTAENRLRLLAARTGEIPPAALAQRRTRRLIRLVCGAGVAVCTLFALLYLCRRDNFTSWELEGVMGQMLLHVGPWGIAAFAMLILAALACGHSLERELAILKDAPRCKPAAAREKRTLPVSVVRMVLFAAAAALIVSGVLNGGWYDVLVKAINICTECIGLG